MWGHKPILSIVLGILGGFLFLQPVADADAESRLRVLILAGKNNHAWQETTPALKRIYEASGRFVVDVLNDPSTCSAQMLKKYDVIAGNWTNFPSRDREWGREAEKSLLEFVRSGKGFVLVHAAGACFPSWPEYQELIGAAWGSNSGHGDYHAFNVTAAEEGHPITQVLGNFIITDELWHRMDVKPSAHILAKAYSDQARGGTGQWEPIAFSSKFGRGRSFYLVLGHDAKAMMNPNWKMLLLRGTEWAATGRAAIEIPFDILEILRAAAGYTRIENRERLAAIEQLAQSSSRNPSLRRQLAKSMTDMLESGATVDFKKFLCEQLSMIGTPAEVPRLAQLLGDKELGFHARFALERLPGNDTLKALRDATNGLSGRLLIGVVNTLGEKRDKQSVKILRRYLRDDQDTEVKSAALQALGKIGGDEVADDLMAQEAGISADLRPVLAEALMNCAEGFESAGKTGEAARIYRKLRDAAQPPHLRAAALFGSVRCEAGEAVRLLLDALGSGDQALQSAVVRIIRTPQGKSSAQGAASRLTTLPESLQSQLIYALADLGDAKILPEINKALSNSSRPVKLAAIYAVGRLGDSSSLEQLIGQIEGADAPERGAVRKSLAGLRGSDLDERLITMMAKSAAPAVKKEVIIALAARGVRQSVPALLKTAEDDTGELRIEALKALGTLADGALAPALVRMAGDERYGGERPYIERALAGMGRRDKTPDRVIDVLLAALPDSQPATRESLLRVLGRFGGEKSFQVVRAYLEDANAEIRNATVRVLSDWPDRSPLDDLLAAAGSSKETVTKVLALQGVANLTGKAVDMPADDRAGIIEQALGIADLPEPKKLLLSVVGRLFSLKALRIATSCLDQTEIVDEAGMAAADISRAIGKDYPKEAQEALAKALERVRSPGVADKIRSVLSDLGLKR